MPQLTEVDARVAVDAADPPAAAIVADDDEHYETEPELEAGSDASDVDDIDDIDALLNESLVDRIAALRDVVPPAQRAALCAAGASVAGAAAAAAKFVGKSAWILTTAASLLILPVMLEVDKESFALQQEAQMRQAQMGAQAPAAPAVPGAPVPAVGKA